MAENKSGDAGKVVLGAGLGAVAVLLATQRAKAQPGTDNEALLNLLAAIEETSLDILQKSADILAAVQGIVIPGVSGTIGVVPNTSGIVSFRIQCVTPAFAYQLPDWKVPDDMQLLVKSWPTNVGLIWVGGANSECTDINKIWPLLPNEMVGYRVSNANSIWVSAVNALDIVVCTVEQRR
jgi:hypothetical protein